MGRELRHVPADWAHPKNDQGYWHPQHERLYRVAAAEYAEALAKWESGEDPDRVVAETETKISGCSAESRVTTVPLPTAVGPDTTVSRAGLTTSAATPSDGCIPNGRC